MEELVERIAKRLYEDALLRYGMSPYHAHCWENQSDDLKNDWRACVRLCVDELKKAGVVK